MVQQPIVVSIGSLVGAFERVSSQVKHFRYTKRNERLSPDLQCSSRPLFEENEFPVVVPQGCELRVIVEIEEFLTWTVGLLSSQVWQKVVTVEMNLVSHFPDCVAI